MPRRVMVLGATGTIGSSIVRALAARGDQLVLVARNRERLAELAAALPESAHVQTIAEDLLDSGACKRIAVAAQTFPVTDLVISVGDFARTPVGTIGAPEVSRLMMVHAIGPLCLVQELSGPLRAAKGAVVAVSDQGVGVPYPNHAAYLGAKGALEGCMRALACDLAPDVRVNIVRTGVVTDSGDPGGNDLSRAARLRSRSLLNRVGQPGEIAEVVITLLFSQWVSGQVWPVG